MEDKLTLDDVSSSLRERVFFAARDGMSLTLYALLYEKNTDEIDELLNTVSTIFFLYKSPRSRPEKFTSFIQVSSVGFSCYSHVNLFLSAVSELPFSFCASDRDLRALLIIFMRRSGLCAFIFWTLTLRSSRKVYKGNLTQILHKYYSINV